MLLRKTVSVSSKIRRKVNVDRIIVRVIIITAVAAVVSHALREKLLRPYRKIRSVVIHLRRIYTPCL